MDATKNLSPLPRVTHRPTAEPTGAADRLLLAKQAARQGLRHRATLYLKLALETRAREIQQ